MPDLLLRGNVTRGLAVNAEGKPDIDKENGVIKGYAVISKGEAKGHEVEIDETTLQQVTELGNALKVGIKSRFGHPTMSGEALGTFLGRAKNFRLDGDTVRADLHLDNTAYNTPKGNLAQYVLDLAESDPAAFGTSIVAKVQHEERLEEDGTRKRDEDGEYLMPLLRVDMLRASDVVDDPAANDSFFSADVELSAEATKFLDKFLQRNDAVEKVANFFENYFAYRLQVTSPEKVALENTEIDNKTKKEKTTMPEEKTEVTFSQEQLDAAVGDAVTSAVEKEKERCTSIFTSALEYAKTGTDVKEIAMTAINAGSEFSKVDAQFKDARIKQLEAEAAAPPPASHIDPADDGQLKHGEHEKHRALAEAYKKENNCSMTEALRATAPKGHASVKA